MESRKRLPIGYRKVGITSFRNGKVLHSFSAPLQGCCSLGWVPAIFLSRSSRTSFSSLAALQIFCIVRSRLHPCSCSFSLKSAAFRSADVQPVRVGGQVYWLTVNEHVFVWFEGGASEYACHTLFELTAFRCIDSEVFAPSEDVQEVVNFSFPHKAPFAFKHVGRRWRE